MRIVVLAIAMATLALAQNSAPENSAKFEVASVRPTAAGNDSLRIDFSPGGRFSGSNMTLQILLRNAYGLEDYQIAGVPAWAASEGFDIEARAAVGTEPTRARMLEMIQTLLAERFHLTAHRETRQLPVYDLVVSKTGPKLRAADADALPDRSMRLGQLVLKKTSMKSLAGLLTFELKRPVRDKTSLAGDFAFTLEWTRGLGESDADPPSRPSIFTAVQEQLGLKLESAKGPVEVLVIDHVDRPSPN